MGWLARLGQALAIGLPIALWAIITAAVLFLVAVWIKETLIGG